MMVMTAKVNFKKILLGLAAAAAVILGLVLLLGGEKDSTPTSATLTGNDGRVAFLEQMGWQVNTSPEESGQVKIPKEQTEVLDRYQALQKSQGYDLSAYAGKTVMRYVYRVTNYPGATDPVYATLLVYKDQIIGGDVTDTSARGKILPLQRQISSTSEKEEPAKTETAPSEAESNSAGAA